jgi:hypothetical protein
MGKFYGKGEPEMAIKYLTEALQISSYDWDDTVKVGFNN